MTLVYVNVRHDCNNLEYKWEKILHIGLRNFIFSRQHWMDVQYN